jgi:hypothetical protein
MIAEILLNWLGSSDIVFFEAMAKASSGDGADQYFSLVQREHNRRVSASPVDGLVIHFHNSIPQPGYRPDLGNTLI